ncbi:transketolase [Candidatus Parcubacteria bacterium]|nr:transketolase [Candidatus Parcubacteria bacterium]
MTPARLKTLEHHARNIRRQTLTMTSRVKAAHTGGSLSVADILTVLYFQILRLNPKRPHDPSRDRLLFSKGHAAAALYATLAERGFFSPKMLDGFYRNGTLLTGHPTRNCLPGVEVTSGSLGHGLAMGAGLAWAAKLDRKPYRTFAILSDGECDEGSVWEAILAAGHRRLDNLIAIIDYNKLQSFGTTKEVLDLEPFKAKWAAFRWTVREVDGHDLTALTTLLSRVPFRKGRPSAIIAHTIKGKGVSFYENTLKSHYQPLDEQQLADVLATL